MDNKQQTSATSNERKLVIALTLTGAYLVAEVVGGLITQSLALLSDAAHMLTDVMALIIALIAIRVGRRAADPRRTFGYYRFEIMAAAFNAIVLFGVALYILYEAWRRFREPPQVHSTGMLVVAVVGLLVNMASMRLLQGDSDKSLNMKGAYLEVWSDLLGSVAVIIAALVIRFTGWWPIDPILAVLIGLWVLPRTWTLLSESLNVLLEGVPAGFELKKLHDALAVLPGVQNVHDLHVWQITSGRNSMSVHLTLNGAAAPDQSLLLAAERVAAEHGIAHTTVQIDQVDRAASEPQAHAPPNWPQAR